SLCVGTLLHGSVVRRRGLDGVSGPRFSPWAATVPFKANQDRRHHIPKQRHRVTNWAAYDIALRQRGSLTVWFTEAAIAAWKPEPRCTRGGQPRYSALAIPTALTLRAVFRLALRQTEGLIASLLRLLHPTIRRSADGARHCRCHDHEPAANRSTCCWTAQGSSFAVPVSGWSRS